MPVGISQDDGLSHGWPGTDKPVIVVSDGSDTEGHCPLGDLQCQGLVYSADGKLRCGFAEHPDLTAEVAACNGRRQEAR